MLEQQASLEPQVCNATTLPCCFLSYFLLCVDYINHKGVYDILLEDENIAEPKYITSPRKKSQK